MRICIIGSCGKKKKTSHKDSPSCSDISGKEDLTYWQQTFEQYCFPAREMYTGNQNRELVKGVDNLRTIDGATVDMFIISAGFGLLEEMELVPPYDCTFSGMRKGELLDRANKLQIPSDFRSKCAERYDLMYLALGKDYFMTLGDGWMDIESAIVVQFSTKDVSSEHIWFPSDNSIVKAFSNKGHKIHGATGFKGDLLRILTKSALRKDDPYGELIGWTDPPYLKQLFIDLYSSGQTTLDY